VHQVQVRVLEAELGQGCVEGAASVVLDRGVLDPQLGGDEQLLPRDAAGGDGAPDGLLVLVGRGGVDVPVADLEGLGDGAFGSSAGIW